MKNPLLPIAMLLSSSLAIVGSAYAATASTTLDVTAVVGTACGVSTTPLDFGFVDPLGDVPAASSIATTCTPGLLINIALDIGKNFDGVQRTMSDGLGNRLPYDLLSPLLGGLWGDGGFAPALDYVSTGNDVFVVDGYIPPQAIPAPDGFYNDVVNVIVTY